MEILQSSNEDAGAEQIALEDARGRQVSASPVRYPKSSPGLQSLGRIPDRTEVTAACSNLAFACSQRSSRRVFARHPESPGGPF